MAKWLLVDGYNIAYRSFFAIPELSNSEGFPTNALHGFLRIMWKLEDQQNPDHIAVLYDLGAPAARETLLPKYKANRKDSPDEFSQQIPWIKKITTALGYHLIEEEGEEADDLIGALAKKLKTNGDKVYIVSADKDLAQCIEPGVFQLVPPPPTNGKVGWRLLDESGVEEKFGVKPTQIVDYLSLIGDNSDNVPGIQGVGPKTACKWIQEYGSLEEIIKKVKYLMPKRLQMPIAENVELLRRNVKLIMLNLSLDVAIPDKMKPNPSKIEEILKEMDMYKALADAKKRYARA